MTDIIASLRRLGLNETESTIYVQLLKKGDLTAVDISKETKIHRRTIYDNLNILINKGLVTFAIKKDIKYFQANNPNIFKRMQEEKNKELESILPDLKSFYGNRRKDPNVSILKGLDSSKSILMEMMESNKEVLWMGGGFKIMDALGYSRDNLLNELSKLNIKIIQPKPKNTQFMKQFSRNNLKIISEKYESHVSFFVYGDTVIVGYLLSDDIFAIKIENKDIAQAYKNYFNIIWEVSRIPNLHLIK